MATVSSAHGAEVVRWVDADGVTHFTDPQFATVDAETVEVLPTNGMEAPPDIYYGRNGKPKFFKIKMKRKSVNNSKAWSGYSKPRRSYLE